MEENIWGDEYIGACSWDGNGCGEQGRGVERVQVPKGKVSSAECSG